MGIFDEKKKTYWSWILYWSAYRFMLSKECKSYFDINKFAIKIPWFVYSLIRVHSNNFCIIFEWFRTIIWMYWISLISKPIDITKSATWKSKLFKFHTHTFPNRIPKWNGIFVIFTVLPRKNRIIQSKLKHLGVVVFFLFSTYACMAFTWAVEHKDNKHQQQMRQSKSIK